MFFEFADYLKGNREYSGMISKMEDDVRDFMEDFHDDPRFLSGWGHGYFCEDDGAALIYNRKEPFRHVCPICGKVYDDFRYETYYVTMYRNEAIGTAVKAAVLYKIFGDKKYLHYVKKIIGYYADNYKYFPVHAKEQLNCSPTIDVGGAGRIMPQGLNEAIIAIRMVNAMEIVKEDLDSEWLLDVKKNLFAPLYELLLPQKMHIHNIPIWLNSAFGIMGLFFGEEEWFREATQYPYNIWQQLNEGLTESGFWYEGSIHYNFFALEGLMTFLVFSKSYGRPAPAAFMDKVKGMLFAAYSYAFDNDRFPNPSDGWPNISLKTYSYIYHMGYKVFGQELLGLLRHIEDGKLERGRLPLSEPYYYDNRISLAQMMYAADYRDYPSAHVPERTSARFDDYNCVLLRSEVFNVFLKYGHQTQSHAHPDKMNIEIMVHDHVLTKDLSNSGYATRICNEWNRTVFAHNTCAVDGQPSDVTRPGELLAFTDDMALARVQAYDGVTYLRQVQIDGNTLKDSFTVTCEKESKIEWFFHFEQPIDRSGLKLVREHDMETEYIIEVFRVETEESGLTIENPLVSMLLVLTPEDNVYIAKTYNNPANQLRDTLIICKRGSKAVFENQITAK